MNENFLRLDASPAYRHALTYWRPLLCANVGDDERAIESTFITFVERSLLPQMHKEAAGRNVLSQIKTTYGEAGSLQCLSDALIKKETTIPIVQASRIEKLRKVCLSPLFLTSLISFCIVASVHVAALLHGTRTEFELIYFSPVVNIVVIFFVFPIIYYLLKRMLK